MTAKEDTVSRKHFLSTVTAFLVVAAIVGTGSAPVYSQAAPAAEVLARVFDVSKGDGTIRVGKKGKAQREFAVERSKSADKLDLTLSERGGAAKSAGFSYEEKNRLITVQLGDGSVKINIQPDGQVMVGGTRCSGNDASCVASALAEALSNIEAEEVAAAVAALEDDLVGMQHGPLILDAMRQLAQQLAG